MEICVFVAGFVVGGLAGMFVMALAAAAPKEIMDKEDSADDG